PAAASLAAAYQTRGAWEVALDALESIARDEPTGTTGRPAAKSGARIVWQVAHYAESGDVAVFPRLLSSARSRTGKDISLEKLQRSTEPYVTQVDRDVLATAHVSWDFANVRSRRRVEVLRLSEAALVPLIGHDDVTDMAGNPLRITRGEGELRA